MEKTGLSRVWAGGEESGRRRRHAVPPSCQIWRGVSSEYSDTVPCRELSPLRVQLLLLEFNVERGVLDTRPPCPSAHARPSQPSTTRPSRP